MFLIGHHWYCVHTVGNLQQRRRGEVDGNHGVLRWISSAAGAHDLLFMIFFFS